MFFFLLFYCCCATINMVNKDLQYNTHSYYKLIFGLLNCAVANDLDRSLRSFKLSVPKISLAYVSGLWSKVQTIQHCRCCHCHFSCYKRFRCRRHKNKAYIMYEVNDDGRTYVVMWAISSTVVVFDRKRHDSQVSCYVSWVQWNWKIRARVLDCTAVSIYRASSINCIEQCFEYYDVDRKCRLPERAPILLYVIPLFDWSVGRSSWLTAAPACMRDTWRLIAQALAPSVYPSVTIHGQCTTPGARPTRCLIHRPINRLSTSPPSLRLPAARAFTACLKLDRIQRLTSRPHTA